MSPTETLNNPLVIKREEEEKSALARVTDWKIETNEDYTALDAFLVTIGALVKKIESDFKDSKSKAHEAWKAIVAQEKGHLDKMEEARRLGKSKLVAWEDEQKRIAKIEQDRLDALARKKAEDDAIAAAALAEKSGDTEKAEAIMAAPVYVEPAPRLAASVPQRSTTVQTRWGATIGGVRMDGTQSDPLFVLKAIEAAGKVLAKSKTKDAQEAVELLRQAYADMAFMEYNQTRINQIATATKGAVRYGGFAVTSRKV